MKKDCPKCSKKKSIEEFYLQKNNIRLSWCKECGKKNSIRIWNNLSVEKKDFLNKKRAKERKEKRIEVLKHYSGEPPKCKCCGESTIEFLAIDHINGGGRKLSKKSGSGSNLIKWIKENNFPKIFQILCHNCNMAKGALGKCPHSL